MVEIKNVSTGTSSDLKEAMKQGGLAGVVDTFLGKMADALEGPANKLELTRFQQELAELPTEKLQQMLTVMLTTLPELALITQVLEKEPTQPTGRERFLKVAKTIFPGLFESKV